MTPRTVLTHPTAQRSAEELEVELLLLRNCKCGARCASAIPFQMSWIEQSQAQQRAEETARVVLNRCGEAWKAQSIADWLRKLAHEIDAQVLAEQVRRTIESARQQAARVEAIKTEKATNAGTREAEELLAGLE